MGFEDRGTPSIEISNRAAGVFPMIVNSLPWLFWITRWREVWSSNPTANHSLRAPSVIIGSGGTFPRSPKCS